MDAHNFELPSIAKELLSLLLLASDVTWMLHCESSIFMGRNMVKFCQKYLAFWQFRISPFWRRIEYLVSKVYRSNRMHWDVQSLKSFTNLHRLQRTDPRVSTFHQRYEKFIWIRVYFKYELVCLYIVSGISYPINRMADFALLKGHQTNLYYLFDSSHFFTAGSSI